MKPLNSFSEMTPFKYFQFAMYWLVLNPYVFVRHGITMSDQLVVGICLLLIRSLYLSGLGKNYSFIQSLMSLWEFLNMFLKFYNRRQRLKYEFQNLFLAAIRNDNEVITLIIFDYQNMSRRRQKVFGVRTQENFEKMIKLKDCSRIVDVTYSQCLLFDLFIQAYYMKDVNYQEELYPLSGWDSIEQNLSYSEIYIKRLQQQIAKVVNSKLPTSPNLPNRTHTRNKSKEYFSTKISNGHLKRDKEFLQQYIKRQKACESGAQSSLTQTHSPEEKTKIQLQMLKSGNQKHQHHKSTQIIIKATQTPEEEGNLLQKYILFSGINKQKSKKRRFFVKINSKDGEQKSNKDICFSSRKQIKLIQKVNLQKMDQSIIQKPDVYQALKKGLKFPLFYRQLNSNEKCFRKDKNKSSINLRQKLEIKFSEEFTDDSIFQSKFIRA